MNTEVWAVPPSAVFLEVSSEGKVRRRYTSLIKPAATFVGRALHTYVKVEKGVRYPIVVVQHNGERLYRPLARLILEAFRGERPRSMVPYYDDGDTMNVRLANLSWAKRNAPDAWYSAERRKAG